MSNLPTKSLLKNDEIQANFKAYKNEINKFETSLVNLKIENLNDCELATNSLTNAKTLVKTLSTIKDSLKSPYITTEKQIEEYFKLLVSPLNKAITVASNTILNFKTLEAQRLKENEKENLKNELQSFESKEKQLELLEKVANSSLARLFGGMAVIGGNKTLFEAPKDLNECQKLRFMFENKFPPMTSFGEFAPSVVVVKELSIKALNEIEQALKKNVTIDYEMLRKKFSIKIETEIQAEKKKFNKQKQKTEKQVKTAANIALKGIRKTIQFQLSDISLVPLNYLTIDEVAIKNYIASNRENLKKMLDETDKGFVEPIKGIQIYYDKNVFG